MRAPRVVVHVISVVWMSVMMIVMSMVVMHVNMIVHVAMDVHVILAGVHVIMMLAFCCSMRE
jgi:ABC-type polysaccharide/polyol phosphate export permease